VKVARAGRA